MVDMDSGTLDVFPLPERVLGIGGAAEIADCRHGASPSRWSSIVISGNVQSKGEPSNIGLACLRLLVLAPARRSSRQRPTFLESETRASRNRASWWLEEKIVLLLRGRRENPDADSRLLPRRPFLSCLRVKEYPSGRLTSTHRMPHFHDNRTGQGCRSGRRRRACARRASLWCAETRPVHAEFQFEFVRTH